MIYNAWGPIEWILLIFILLILFGSKRIPEIARSLGEAVKEFRRSMSETEQVRKAITESERATNPQLEAQREFATSQRTQVGVYQEDPLIELARNKGIRVEGKTRVQIVEELAKKIKEEESTS